MTAPATTATSKPAIRTRASRRIARTPLQRDRTSVDPHRPFESDAAPREAAPFPEALIGVPFN